MESLKFPQRIEMEDLIRLAGQKRGEAEIGTQSQLLPGDNEVVRPTLTLRNLTAPSQRESTTLPATLSPSSHHPATDIGR